MTHQRTYHQRQVGPSVKTPPNNGPNTLARPYVAPIMPVNAGRLWGGTTKAIMM